MGVSGDDAAEAVASEQRDVAPRQLLESDLIAKTPGEVAAIRAELPSLVQVITVPYLDPQAPPPTGAMSWAEFAAPTGGAPRPSGRAAPRHPGHEPMEPGPSRYR